MSILNALKRRVEERVVDDAKRSARAPQPKPNKKKVVSPSQSLTDQLPYQGIRDGVVFNFDGTYEFGLEFFLPSRAQVPDSIRDNLTERLRLALIQSLPQRARARIIIESVTSTDQMIRRHRGSVRTQNELLQLIADSEFDNLEKSRLRGEITEKRYFLTVRMPHRKKALNSSYSEREINEILQGIRSVQEQLSNMMVVGGFPCLKMTTQESFSLIWRYHNMGFNSSKPPLYREHFNTGNYSLKDIAADPALQVPTTRSQIAESAIDNSRFYALVVGDRLVSAVSLVEVGESTTPGMLERLIERLGNRNFYLNIDIDYLYQADVRRKLSNDARGLAIANEEATVGGIPDVANQAIADSFNQALYELAASEEAVFEFGVCCMLIARDRDELESMKEITRSEISMLAGARANVGSVQNIVQFMALAPFGGKNNEFMFKSMSRNVSDLIPLMGPWYGQVNPMVLYRNRLGGLTGVNQSEEVLNYGKLVIGGAGSGKTFFMQNDIINFHMRGGEVMITDIKQDYLTTVQALKGEVVIIRPGAIVPGTDLKVCLNAFKLAPGELEPDDNQRLFLSAVFDCIIEPDPLTRDTEKAIQEAAVTNMYRLNKARLERGDELTLTDFLKSMKALNQIGTEPIGKDVRTLIDKMALKLQSCTGESLLGSFLDGHSTVNINNKVVYFDISALKEDPKLSQVGLLLVTNLIWQRAKSSNRKIPKMAVIEEAGTFFGNPDAVEFVRRLYKVGRAYNLWPVAITQEIGDFRKAKGLINNTTSFVIGRVKEEEAREIVDVLGLNSGVLDMIMSLRVVQGQYAEYVVLVDKDRGLEGDIVRLEPSRVLYWMSSSKPADQALREETKLKYSGNLVSAIKELAGLQA